MIWILSIVVVILCAAVYELFDDLKDQDFHIRNLCERVASTDLKYRGIYKRLCDSCSQEEIKELNKDVYYYYDHEIEKNKEQK